jgi:hypothetical protein
VEGHGLATLGAAAAEFSTPEHGFVMAAHLLAIIRTEGADLGAHLTVTMMVFGQSRHKAGGGEASLGAIGEQCLVFRGSMFAAEHEAMLRCLEAEGMAVQAVGDALAHFAVHLVGMGHRRSPGLKIGAGSFCF